MKQSKLILTVFVAALVIFGSAFTTFSSVPKTKLTGKSLINEGNAHVNGGGTALENGKKSTFVFNAVELPDGSVNGHLVYNYRAGDNQVDLDITCLSISGNRATLSGTVTSATGNVPNFITVGGTASFTVEDAGQGHGAADKISDLIFSIGSYTVSCNDNWRTYILMNGNITIKE